MLLFPTISLPASHDSSTSMKSIAKQKLFNLAVRLPCCEYLYGNFRTLLICFHRYSISVVMPTIPTCPSSRQTTE